MLGADDSGGRNLKITPRGEGINLQNLIELKKIGQDNFSEGDQEHVSMKIDGGSLFVVFCVLQIDVRADRPCCGLSGRGVA